MNFTRMPPHGMDDSDNKLGVLEGMMLAFQSAKVFLVGFGIQSALRSTTKKVFSLVKVPVTA